MKIPHTPVLLKEMLAVISSKSGEEYIDCTFGAGGYTAALLGSTDCSVYGVDQDSSVEKYANPLYREFPNKFRLFIEKFSNIHLLMEGKEVDGIIFDLGISSMQIEEANRGFSFMKEGPLDMRMSTEDKINAATVVSAFTEEKIANIIYQYSNERHSRKIAAAIIRERNRKIITTTTELAKIVRSVIPRRKQDKIDPATRTFQAIRIWVNNELKELERGIEVAAELLKIGGRIVVVSFHSLEDKIVKDKFNLLSGKNIGESRYSPLSYNKIINPNFTLLNKKVIKPTTEEINLNPRASSAKLRAIKRIV